MATLTTNRKAALRQATIYYEGVVGKGNGENSDVSRVDGVKRDPERVKRLMRSLSRQQGTQAPLKTIYQDIVANDVDSLKEETISAYITALKKIFCVEDMPAWNPCLRSKTAIRTSDTRYFVDPSIAVAAMRIGPKDLINDLETMGLLFESMVVRDLRVYAEALDGHIYHYRDKNNLECDAVLHLENGKYGLIEIKLGGDEAIAKGASTLQALANKIDTTRMTKPSFLMVVVGIGKHAYRRQEDGVYVVPIGCLKP
jgi:predicted AAA+ superfamily ATPase